jgi:hypothetical protein
LQSAPGARENFRLPSERLGRTIVPDHVIGAGDLFVQGHLRGNYFKGSGFSQRGTRNQPLQLHRRGAGDDDHAIAEGFTACFVKKRYVCKKKLGGVSPAFGFGSPLTPDARMQNLLKRAFLFRVGENYGAKLGAIQVSAGGINLGPEALANRGSRFGITVGQLARCDIGIEKLSVPQKLAELRSEGALSCRYATGDADYHQRRRRKA